MSLQATYTNSMNRPLSLTGSNAVRLDKLDFDTSCPCQITACDGGTIKFCAKVEFDPPLPPQPHSDGTCESPIPEAVFTKIKFSGESSCQIGNCDTRGEDAIVVCNELNTSAGLLGVYAGTCDNPFETMVTQELKFGGEGECQIESCDGESTILACSPFNFIQGLIGGYAGTCDNPFEEMVTNVLKFGEGGDCQIVSCEEAQTITFCSPVKFSEGFTFDGDICDINGSFTAMNYTALNGYWLENGESTCESPLGRMRGLSFLSDNSVVTAPVLSTELGCYVDGEVGNATIVINNVGSQPFLNPTTGTGLSNSQGIRIRGGSIDSLKNMAIETTTDASITDAEIRIRAKGVGGKIGIESDDTVSINSVQNQSVLSARKEVIINSRDNDISLLADRDIRLTSTNGTLETKSDDNTIMRVGGNADIEVDLVTNMTSVNDTNIKSTTGAVNIQATAGVVSIQSNQIASPPSAVNINSALIDTTGKIDCANIAVGQAVTAQFVNTTGDISADGHVRGKKGCGMGNYTIGNNPPPAFDYGKIGDKAGDLAFEPYSTTPYGLYLYICFKDHSGVFPDTTPIWFRSKKAIFDQTF